MFNLGKTYGVRTMLNVPKKLRHRDHVKFIEMQCLFFYVLTAVLTEYIYYLLLLSKERLFCLVFVCACVCVFVFVLFCVCVVHSLCSFNILLSFSLVS